MCSYCQGMEFLSLWKTNVREDLRGTQEWTIQRHGHRWVGNQEWTIQGHGHRWVGNQEWTIQGHGHRWVQCIITITNNKKHNTEVDLRFITLYLYRII
jgi:hypothetical protein